MSVKATQPSSVGSRTQPAGRSAYARVMPSAETPVIYCYDGSERARHALSVAAKILGERRAVVVTVWRSSWVAVAAAPYAFLPGDTVKTMDAAADDAAKSVAIEGAALVPGASARALPSAGSVWCAVLDFADDCDAELIVVGSRGLSGIKFGGAGKRLTRLGQPQPPVGDGRTVSSRPLILAATATAIESASSSISMMAAPRPPASSSIS